MTEKIAAKVNTFCYWLEKRLGFVGTGLAIGFVLLLLGFIYVLPHLFIN